MKPDRDPVREENQMDARGVPSPGNYIGLPLFCFLLYLVIDAVMHTTSSIIGSLISDRRLFVFVVIVIGLLAAADLIWATRKNKAEK